MKRLFAVACVICCMASIPAFAHTYSLGGWTGPIAGGGTSSDHPENLCNSFSTYTCVVGGAHSFGTALKKWPINVSNSGGLNTSYLTNDTNTPGWIVVIGNTGLSWNLSAPAGTYDGKLCQIMTPGSAGGFASLSWGPSKYYYQAVFGGSYAGGLCAGF